MSCPICLSLRTHTLRTPRRNFFRCEVCGAVFAEGDTVPDVASARNRYLLHHNSREDKGYVAFLSDIIDLSLAAAGPGVRDVIDWGSGPEPVCSGLLRERGFSVHSWDPIFDAGAEPDSRSCDMALCIEVAEHFADPVGDFSQVAAKIKPGGLLAVHTAQVPESDTEFTSWWYQEDPTHIVFYSKQSLRRLGDTAGLVFLGIQGRRLAFFRKPLPVLVAGGMNLDIQGRSFLPPVSGDSNPGTLRFAPGGAGRNMAENLVRLGASVEFLSVRGNDLAGHECAEKTAHAGVGMAGVRVLEGETSSCYLAILDDRGDMSLALAAMDIYERLDPGAVLETAGLVEQTSGLACFRGTSSQPFSALLVDGNLRPDTIESLIDRFPGVPVWFDPVSGAKARRFAEYCGGRLLSRISAMKPNDLELAVILDTLGSEAVSTTLPDTGSGGARVPSRAEKALMAARLLRDFGVGAVYVSLGAEGVAWDSGDSSGRYVPPAVETVSATGAGDALLATLAWSRVLGISPSEAVPLACAAATLTLGTTYACNPELSFSALLNHI